MKMRAKVGALLTGFLVASLPGLAHAYRCDDYYSDYEIEAKIAGVYADHGYDIPQDAIAIGTLDDGTRALVIQATAGRNDLEEILLIGFV